MIAKKRSVNDKVRQTLRCHWREITGGTERGGAEGSCRDRDEVENEGWGLKGNDSGKDGGDEISANFTLK